MEKELETFERVTKICLNYKNGKTTIKDFAGWLSTTLIPDQYKYRKELQEKLYEVQDDLESFIAVAQDSYENITNYNEDAKKLADELLEYVQRLKDNEV